MTKKLTKSINKKVSGVCGGLAEYFDLDPTLVRVVYFCLTFLTSWFPGLILYYPGFVHAEAGNQADRRLKDLVIVILFRYTVIPAFRNSGMTEYRKNENPAKKIYNPLNSHYYDTNNHPDHPRSQH